MEKKRSGLVKSDEGHLMQRTVWNKTRRRMNERPWDKYKKARNDYVICRGNEI